MNTTLQIRMNQKIKEKARRVFRSMGLDMSSGVNMYLARVANTGEIPFNAFTFDNIPEQEKKKIMAEMRRELKCGKMKLYDNVSEMHREILGKKPSTNLKLVLGK